MRDFRRCAMVVWASAFCWAAASAGAQEAVSLEKGIDVGDGQVLYDIPYDPKTLSAIAFAAPTVQHPFYEIAIPMGDWTEGTSATLQKVRVNGVDCDSFYAFVDGFSHVQSGWITQKSATAKNVVLVARALWHNGEDVKVEADISAVGADAAAKTVTKSFTAKAPAQGGGPEGWRRYQSVLLEEKAGLARQNEPVEFTVTARAEDCADLVRELRLFAVDGAAGLSPVPFQTFNARRFQGTPPGTSNANYLQHPSQVADVVFLANVPANSSQVYVVAYDNPKAEALADPKTDLKVTGPSLGATVENQYYTVQLDKRSGQIGSFDLKGRESNPVPRLTNSYSFAVHWNPDSFSDNGKWGHTFAWNPPDETVVTARGPILFRVTSSGRMPDSTPQVHASVTYSFYAGTPYVKVTTVTEVRDPLNASAIRNGEVVLDSHLITNFVWQEKSGQIHTVRTAHGPDWQDEWAARVDQDVPWIAMTNETNDYGIGAVVASSISFNAKRGEATVHRPAYYLYSHHFWRIPVTYFTRGWMYPFSDYQRGPIIPVEAGSTYVEKAAFVPFFLHDDGSRYRDIEAVSTAMQNPLAQRWGR